jgi:lysozyme
MQARDPQNSAGVDLSHYQGNIDWQKVKNDPKEIKFAILKATEGHTFTDDKVSANYQGAKSIGLAVGLYHFCRASNPKEAAAEANFFCSVIDQFGGIEAFDIPPVLDIETAVAQTKEQISAICRAWLSIIEAKYNVKPMLYCDPGFAVQYLDDSLAEYPLWFACWARDTPPDCCGWKEWKFLQYTDKGSVQGINGPVDMNEFCGTKEDLENIMGYKMTAEDANQMIAILKGIHAAGIGQDEVHRLAVVLRKASGQAEE